MSEYIKKTVEFSDEDLLVEALGETWGRGGAPVPVERHAEPTGLYGYHGDLRPEKAHIIVRRASIGAAANDVGYLRTGAGQYVEVVSQNERGWARDKLLAVKRLYGEKIALKAAKSRGWKKLVSRTVEADGRVVLRLGR